MKLTLTSDSGVVLDETSVSRKEFDLAKSRGVVAQSILASLHAGDADGEQYDKSYDEDDDEPESRSGSSYFNAAGEPLMTAAQAQTEAELDELSRYESAYDRDDFGPEYYEEGCEI